MVPVVRDARPTGSAETVQTSAVPPLHVARQRTAELRESVGRIPECAEDRRALLGRQGDE